MAGRRLAEPLPARHLRPMALDFAYAKRIAKVPRDHARVHRPRAVSPACPGAAAQPAEPRKTPAQSLTCDLAPVIAGAASHIGRRAGRFSNFCHPGGASDDHVATEPARPAGTCSATRAIALKARPVRPVPAPPGYLAQAVAPSWVAIGFTVRILYVASATRSVIPARSLAWALATASLKRAVECSPAAMN